jgi:hypothetical protein
VHEEALVPVEDAKVPGAQAEQTWSLVEEPAVLTYVPAAQEVHATQLDCPGEDANVPVVQDEQASASSVAL